MILCHLRVPGDDFGVLFRRGSSKVHPGTSQKPPQRRNGPQSGSFDGSLCTLLTPRATQKQYSGQPGSQNGSKMEVKMEPNRGLPTLTKPAPACTDRTSDPSVGRSFLTPVSGPPKNMKKCERKVPFRKQNAFEISTKRRDTPQESKMVSKGPPRKFSSAEKELKWVQWYRAQKNSSPGRVQYAIRTCRRMFREGQQPRFGSILSPFWRHFGSQVGHYTPQGGPWRAKKVSKI